MTYDYAGNRSNSGYAYDELNRMTASPGSMAYTNDAVGNRTGRNMSVLNSSTAVRYDWDHLNRLEKVVGTTNGYRNEYRADGMRVKKVSGFNLSWAWLDKAHTSGYYDEITATNLPTTRYFYDGQTCMEDELTDNSVVTTTKYGLGARGIDYIERQVGSGSPTIGFPVYDAHGNMVMTLSRASSSPWFTDGLHRGYDVWGSVRWNPSASSDIKQRYCANLGHVEDDESGLSYMRARFYEPWTGRFVSQDTAREGINFYVYCGNNPITNCDPSGNNTAEDLLLAFGVIALIFGGLFMGVGVTYSIRGLADMKELMGDYKRMAVEFMDNIPSDAFDKLMQRELNVQEMRISGRTMTRAGRGLAASGIAALIGYSLLIRGFQADTDLAFMGSNLSVFDYVQF